MENQKVQQKVKDIIDEQKLTNRHLGSQITEERVYIDLASDELTFKEKSTIDLQLNSAWNNSTPKLIVNFKRRTPKPEATRPQPKSPISMNLSQNNPKGIDNVSKIILVASGKGGVGKSTIASNISISLKKDGYAVGLLDADLQGPSAPAIFNLTGPLTISANEKIQPKEAYGVKVQSFGFMMDSMSPFVSKGPILSKTLEQLLFKTDWGHLDYLVIDTPPGTGDIHLSLIQNIKIDGAIIVTTPQGIALADVHKGVSFLERSDTPLLGVIENMHHHVCSSCGHTEAIFGKGVDQFCKERNIPLLGRIPLTPMINASEEQGNPPSLEDSLISEAFGEICQRIVDW